MKKALVIILAVTLANCANAALSLSANELFVGVGQTATIDIMSSDNLGWTGYFGALPCASVEIVSITPLPAAGPDASVVVSPYGYAGYFEFTAVDFTSPSDVTPGSQFRITFRGLAYGSCDFDLYDADWITVLDTVTVSTIGARVISPNGGEVIEAGSIFPIIFEVSQGGGLAGYIEYSTDNGASWTIIAADDSSPLPWYVPMVDSDQCLVRLDSMDDMGNYDQSDSTFTIYQCQLSSAADLNNDCKVTMPDLAITSAGWSDLYDISDLAILAADWLRNGNPFDPLYTEAP